MVDLQGPLNLTYKRVNDIPLLLDIYPPAGFPKEPHDAEPGQPLRYAAVVYFHGGGLIVGDRKSWFPSWLYSKYGWKSLLPWLACGDI